MVKILQAYNFAKQHTYALNGDILSATLIDSTRIAVSSAEQFIEIYDIGGKQRRSELLLDPGIAKDYAASDADAAANNDERLPTKHTLATVGEVVHLIYCAAGKYLLTLEKETLSSPVQTGNSSISCTSSSNTNTVCSDDDTKMFVRIYANFWKFPDSKLISLPITIRIASMTTPKAPLVESIDVIELPLRSPPELIQCCQTSGNIIVSSKERIYLYEYTQCIHETTQPRFSYIDFLPFKFFVNLNFIPLRLCLAENVIACMNNRYCVAFKVVDVVGSSAAGGVHSSPLDNDYGIDGGGGGCGGIGTDDAAEVDVDEAISSTESSLMSKVSAGPSSHNSFETDSLETTSSGRPLGAAGFPGRTPIDFNVARMVNSACGREFEVELKSQWEVGGGDGHTGVGTGMGTGCTAGNVGGDTQEIIITPTRANDIKIKLVNEAKAMNVQRVASHSNMMSTYNEDTSVQYDIRKLLQICMKSSEPNSRIVDILRCIDLKAIYQRNTNDTDDVEDSEYDMGNQQVPGAVTTTKHVNRRTLKSNQHHSCVGYALLVASSVDGYLYQFCAQGKWYNENEKPIATYSFTAPVLKVHINDYVIYAITTESVETHTSRIGHKLFNNRFEYPTIGSLFPEESSPDVNAAIAVIGLCSFMHVQYVCVNRNNLVLISNSALATSHNDSHTHKRRSGGGGVTTGGETKRNIAARLLAETKVKHLLRSGNATQPTLPNEWTLYNLEVPAVEYVIEDLEGIADSYRAASSTNFYDLMEEAHVMLRLSLSLQCEQLQDEREQLLRNRFMENCRKLADFSIRSRKKEVYLQATGFYKMCNLQLSDIYNNYITSYAQHQLNDTLVSRSLLLQSNEESQLEGEQLVGLIYTVKMFLLGLGTDRIAAAFLNQLVEPFFTPSCIIEPGYAQVSLSLEFLNMFKKFSTADIPQIMLNSPVVADAISGKLVNYLKYLDKLNPDESLLLAVTACRMSNYLLAQEVIARTSRRELAVALIKHKNVLFDDGTVLFKRHDRFEVRTPYNRCPVTPTPMHNNRAAHILRRQQQQQQQHKRKPSFAGNLVSTQQQQQPQSTHNVVSFSDFTETILLATENTELIEAISDAFIHALCIEHSISLDMILQLFLNYIASHIGHKGYQTSQKVFVTILQVYYYDYFDVNPLSNPHDMPSNTPPHIDDYYEDTSSKAASLNSERDNESIANSLPESNSGASSSLDERSYSHRHNRIVYDQLQDQNSPYKRNLNNISPTQPLADDQQSLTGGQSDSETNLKGLKILFRMYLGRLKALSDLITDLQSADIEQQPVNADFINLRIECIKFMIRHLQEMRSQQQSMAYQRNNGTAQYYYAKSNCGGVNAQSNDERKFIYVPFLPDYKLAGEEYDRYVKAYVRPIPCLIERPQYLNRLPPFRREDFSFPNPDEGECEVRFLGWHNELLTLTLKIQSLLATPRIEREIIEEFIAFIQKTPDLIGIDSFLVIILPKNLAINYMLNFCPEYMWQYGKSNGFTPKHWESLLRKILSKQDVLPNWKAHITEILNNLVAELSFEELLQCFPSEVIKQTKTNNRAAFINEKLSSDALKSSKDFNNTTKCTRDHLPMDNIDENNVFELTLRKAVSKQRSIALRSMIESTGTQLFDATSNPMYNI